MGNKQTIVIIEDDVFLAKMYEKKLQLEGFEVRVAFNAEEGFKLCLEFKPELLILDLLLPGISGWELLETLKENKKTETIPVLILTNLSKEEQVKRGLSLGAVDYLVKVNWLPSEVIAKVKEILWKHKKNFI